MYWPDLTHPKQYSVVFLHSMSDVDLQMNMKSLLGSIYARINRDYS